MAQKLFESKQELYTMTIGELREVARLFNSQHSADKAITIYIRDSKFDIVDNIAQHLRLTNKNPMYKPTSEELHRMYKYELSHIIKQSGALPSSLKTKDELIAYILSKKLMTDYISPKHFKKSDKLYTEEELVSLYSDQLRNLANQVGISYFKLRKYGLVQRLLAHGITKEYKPIPHGSTKWSIDYDPTGQTGYE